VVLGGGGLVLKKSGDNQTFKKNQAHDLGFNAGIVLRRLNNKKGSRGKRKERRRQPIMMGGIARFREERELGERRRPMVDQNTGRHVLCKNFRTNDTEKT